MRYWKKLVSASLVTALAACATAPDVDAQLSVRSASIAHAVLSARLEWHPRDVVLDALDHGIALDFALTLQAQTPQWLGLRNTLLRSERHLQLRYFPLSRQYQLRDLDLGDTRSYASRAMLIAAFEDLRLQLPPEWNATAGNPVAAQRYELHIELQRDTLPGAMRLPALLLSDWRLSTGDYTWPAADAG